MSAKQFLDEGELSRRWGIARGTLRYWRYRKKGPKFVKFPNGAVRYNLNVVTKYEREFLK